MLRSEVTAFTLNSNLSFLMSSFFPLRADKANSEALTGAARLFLSLEQNEHVFMYQALMKIHSSERSRCPEQLFQVSNNIRHQMF